MNPKALVKISNAIGLISITALIYWIFIFITVQVFGLKIFREKITQSFGMSILAILALMAGALIINVMYNLTRIADKHNTDLEATSKSIPFFYKLLLASSFPILVLGLFVGDRYSAKRKEMLLSNIASKIVENNILKLKKIGEYEFNSRWLVETDNILDILSKSDKNFPYIHVIFEDQIEGDYVYLTFRDFYPDSSQVKELQKKDYLYATDKSERIYFDKVFKSKINETFFTKDNGNYQLYFPIFETVT